LGLFSSVKNDMLHQSHCCCHDNKYESCFLSDESTSIHFM